MVFTYKSSVNIDVRMHIRTVEVKYDFSVIKRLGDGKPFTVPARSA